MVANIVQYILDNFQGSTPKEITRCLNKATIIVFDTDGVLVADDMYIYYFGTTAKKRKSKKFYKFYKKHSNHLLGKYFFSANITAYKNHCQYISSNCNMPYNKVYQWMAK
jgi:hypothetical protein